MVPDVSVLQDKQEEYFMYLNNDKELSAVSTSNISSLDDIFLTTRITSSNSFRRC